MVLTRTVLQYFISHVWQMAQTVEIGDESFELALCFKTFDSDIGSPPVIRAKGVFVKLRGSRLERHEPGTASRDSSVGVLAIRTSDQGKRQHLLQANTC